MLIRVFGHIHRLGGQVALAHLPIPSCKEVNVAQEIYQTKPNLAIWLPNAEAVPDVLKRGHKGWLSRSQGVALGCTELGTKPFLLTQPLDPQDGALANDHHPAGLPQQAGARA